MKEKTRAKSKRKIIIVVLISITPLCTLLPYLSPSVLMNDIMADLNIGLSLAGLMMTVMMVSCGLCMFIGSILHDLIGIRITLILAVWLLSVGSVICFAARSFSLLIIGRIVLGIGFGLHSASTAPYMSTWFEGKQRTFMITASLIANSLAGAASYMIANPLKELVGSWRGVFGLYAVFIALIAILWTIFSRSNDTEKYNNRNKKARKSSLSGAFKIKQFWLLMICGIFLNFAITANTTYVPTLLVSEKGFSTTTAALASSINSFVNLGGPLLGGVLVARTGKRKIVMQSGMVFFLIGGMVMTIANAQTFVFIGLILCGFSYMFLMPAQTTIIMETHEPFDPAIVGAATAMITGVGQITSIMVSPLFSKLSESLGMSAAMRTFFGMVFISVIASLFIRETGGKETNGFGNKEKRRIRDKESTALSRLDPED